jgi:predicted TPR repeat methyltransferase
MLLTSPPAFGLIPRPLLPGEKWSKKKIFRLLAPLTWERGRGDVDFKLILSLRFNFNMEGKKAKVESMFDSIAWRYDFLNHFLSFSIDRLWRRRAIRIISKTHKRAEILDVATGTGDLAIAAMKLDPIKIIGIDISRNMLEIGRIKIAKKSLVCLM